MKKFSLEQLSEGIRDRNLSADGKRLVEKWSRTGLLRGLDGVKRDNMARLLENQAAQLLKETNAISTGAGGLTSSGQIQGFANIAFPMVRRVFGGLVANELVSIQPMSLPSGLIFYVDYTYGNNVGGDSGVALSGAATTPTYQRGQSIYNNPVGRGIQSGSLAAGGMYDLVGDGYSKVHLNSTSLSGSNVWTGAWTTGPAESWTASGTVGAATDFTGTNAVNAQFDPQVEADLASNTLDFTFVHIPVSDFRTAIPNGDLTALDQINLYGVSITQGATAWGSSYQAGAGVLNLRRLTRRGNFSATAKTFTVDPFNGTHIQFVVRLNNGGTAPNVGLANSVSMATADAVRNADLGTPGTVLTIPSFESDFGATPSPAIPEIDIKVESIAVTATTRKLRAKWTPELAQDLNAYQSLDAEVELTQILSEQIALEIDREILQDLLTQANGASLFWSRAPGKFVNKVTGSPVSLANSLSIGPAFTGTVRDWYETLIETIIDVSNTIHRKTLRGSANFIVVSPDVATILEASVAYRPKVSIDGDGQVSATFSIGAEAVGTLNNRFTVYKDPYFPRNKILVGFKGGGFLETGYVYAPYVPLIVTPTLFAPEDFTPRKGVMTRYGKKMVRSDFYGVVTVLDMNII